MPALPIENMDYVGFKKRGGITVRNAGLRLVLRLEISVIRIQ